MNTRTTLTRSAESQNTWVLVFVLGYLALLADGADVMMYGLTLTRIKDEFALSNVEAGALGALTLCGMAIGGGVGSWGRGGLGGGEGGAVGVVRFFVGGRRLVCLPNFFLFVGA